jgi:hypothetical protein
MINQSQQYPNCQCNSIVANVSLDPFILLYWWFLKKKSINIRKNMITLFLSMQNNPTLVLGSSMPDTR